MSYVTLRVEDKDGNFAPKAGPWVNLSLEGPGRIVGLGNGDPLSHESFQGSSVCAFNGLALVIIAATGAPDKHIPPNSTRRPGEIVVKASSKGMPPAEVRITTVPPVSVVPENPSPSPDSKPADKETRPVLE